MIKVYSFDYDYAKAYCAFEVDLNKYLEEHAQATLDFFTWDYDEDGDPIDELMKKLAMEILREASSYTLYGLKKLQLEGFPKIDGSSGINLIKVESFELEEEDLEITTYIKS